MIIKKINCLIAFWLHLASVLAVTLVPISPHSSKNISQINFVPVTNTIRWVMVNINYPHDGIIRFFPLINILGNLILFLPLGLLLPLTFKKIKCYYQVFIIAFLCSLIVELLQLISTYLGRPRTSDIDDIILNSFGALFGFMIYKLLYLLYDGRIYRI